MLGVGARSRRSVLPRYAAGNPLWQAGGVLYLGLPRCALVALARACAARRAGSSWACSSIVWATDTGALISGNLIGGPKLAPALSPNKTWAGTIGGIVTAAIVDAVYVGILGGNPVLAACFGAGICRVVAHAGDLFESWVKRVVPAQGYRRADPRPWRRAGPHRFHAVRRVALAAARVRCSDSIRCSERIHEPARRHPQAFRDLPDLAPVLARSVTVLGSTGSIGVNTLDVIAHARKVYGAGRLSDRGADRAGAMSTC